MTIERTMVDLGHDKDDWIWTTHIERQMQERKIARALIELTLADPDDRVPGKKTRLVYQKMSGDKLVRVVTEGNSLITVYVTDKIKKYTRG